MKARIFLFSFVWIAGVALVFPGCKGGKKSNGNAVADPNAEFLVINHVGCRGTCPAYNVIVKEGGYVRYEGRRAVEMMGFFEKEIDQPKVKELKETLLAAKFFEFDSLYGGGVADLPYVIITATIDGKKKSVTNIRFAPESLNALPEKLEKIIGSDGYRQRTGE